MRWRVLAAVVALAGLPCGVSSCASKCADEKCGPPVDYLVSGTLVTVKRVDGKVTSKPTVGQILFYLGAVPGQGTPSKLRTTSSGAFQIHLSAGTYFFTGKADDTGVACTTAAAIVVNPSNVEPQVTVKCPTK